MLRSKKKGFTLVELIITMALALVVTGAIFSFFIVSKKISTQTEVKSDMQRDASKAQETIIDVGTQADGLDDLRLSGNRPVNTDAALGFVTIGSYSSDPKFNNGALSGIKTFSFNLPKGLSLYNITLADDDYLKFVYTIDNNNRLICEIYKVSGAAEDKVEQKDVCENVSDITVKPINWESLKTKDPSTEMYSNVSGLKITINLEMSRGFSRNMKYSIDSIVKFRNKGKEVI